MSAISEVKICNQSLTLVGADRITARDQDSKNAKTCDALYDEVRDDVLTDHPWTFAQLRAILATLDEDPVYTDDGVTVIYQLPTDLLKVNFTSVENALVKIEGKKLLSDTTGLKIKYTFRVTDPQQFSPKFITCFATKLAAKIAYAISSSRSLAADLFKLYYDKELPDAVTVDSQQGTPLEPAQDEWTLSRITGGAGQIAGRTGAGTWFPIGC